MSHAQVAASAWVVPHCSAVLVLILVANKVVIQFTDLRVPLHVAVWENMVPDSKFCDASLNRSH